MAHKLEHSKTEKRVLKEKGAKEGTKSAHVALKKKKRLSSDGYMRG